MRGIINKEIETKNGILIIIAATLIILGGILLTNIDLIFGAGTGDADTLDSMDWAGDDCSGVNCNIKDYIDTKSTPCTDDNTGQCYITQATKSALDTDLAAGNIKSGINVFGVAGSYSGPAYNDCTADNGGSCYISQASKSALDADLVAGNIKSGVNIFGVTGTAKIMCKTGSAARCWTGYCAIGTACSKTCYPPGDSWIKVYTYVLPGRPVANDCVIDGVRRDCEDSYGVSIVCEQW